MQDWVNENNNLWSYKDIKNCFLSGKSYYMRPENGSQEVEASTNDYTKVHNVEIIPAEYREFRTFIGLFVDL